ncbi:MAG: HU family DNA-binding protein [Bacteroides sp.]|jgi:DNA-binding protein HU-beta/integration host factor subunit alpha|nr:HU family DNA-binding protein [Bacteroides sp.]MCI1684057.1 HU family DNA-binding protein [Bacteroides sp.]
MNKNSFAKELANRLNCSNVVAKKIIREYNNLIVDKIQEGYSVKLQYFGVFSPYMREGRDVRNPQNGDVCKISSRITIKFKPSECVLKKVNEE